MWIWWVFLPGYHVNVIATGLSTVDGIYALTGCSTPLNIKDRGCADSINVTYTHVPLAQTEKACPKAKKQIFKVFSACVSVAKATLNGNARWQWNPGCRRGRILGMSFRRNILPQLLAVLAAWVMMDEFLCSSARQSEREPGRVKVSV